MKRRKQLHQDYLHVHILFFCGALMIGVFVFSVSKNILAITFPAAVSQDTAAEDRMTEATISVSALPIVPLAFEPNVGQADSAVDFVVHKGSELIHISATELASRAVTQRLVKANARAKPSGVGAQASVSNYFIGNDPKKWHTEIPNYQKAAYTNVYPHIDLEYASDEGQLNYQFTIQPGGDPKKIEFSLDGVTSVVVTKDAITADTSTGQLTWGKLYAFQMIGGSKTQVPAEFIAKGKSGYGFSVGKYDKTVPLIIDPQLLYQYGTYLGGTGSDAGTGFTFDSSGNLYIAGNTDSTDFPLESPFQGTKAALADLFVSKLNAAGTALVYSTYIGGNAGEIGSRIAVDSTGNVYFTGSTASTDFPTVTPIQGSFAGVSDWFVLKLNPSGSALTWSTYYGGSLNDNTPRMAMDTANDLYFTSGVGTGFPTFNAFQSVLGGGSQDAAIVKITSAGVLVYSTFLGGNGVDQGFAIAVDSGSNVIITGNTGSTDYPTVNAYQGTFGGGTLDVFMSKLNAAGTALVYSTYLGGTGAGTEQGLAMAVDASDNAYVGCITSSTDFPVLNAYQSTYGGSQDDCFAKFSPTGTLLFSTYFGGTAAEAGNGPRIAIDHDQNVILGIATSSDGLPVLNASQTTRAGGVDVYFANLSTNGTSLMFGSYFGGTGTETISNLVTDTNSVLYLVGNTTSSDFPVTSGAFQSTNHGGANEVYLAKIAFSLCPPCGGGGAIAPRIALSSPRSDDRFHGGDVVNVEWIAQSLELTTSKTATLSLTLDAGKTFSVVADELPIDQPYSWTVPYLGADTPAKLRVELKDASGGMSLWDQNEHFFTILQTAEPIPPQSEPIEIPPVVTVEPPVIDSLASLGLAVHDLVRMPQEKSVFYLGADGKRHRFTSIKIFASWYCDFSSVRIIPQHILEAIPLGSNVQYRPGLGMVKSPMNPKVYAVDVDWMLRPIADEKTAAALYGPLWSNNVDDVSEMFYADYSFGEELNSASDFSPVVKIQSVQFPSDAMNIPGYQSSVGEFPFTCPTPAAATQSEAHFRFTISNLLNWLKHAF